MTGFFERILHGARAPIGAPEVPLQRPAPLEVVAAAGDTEADEATAPPALPAETRSAPPAPVKRREPVVFTPSRPAREEVAPRVSAPPSTNARDRALAASPSPPLRDAGVRAAVVVPKAGEPAASGAAGSRAAGAAPTSTQDAASDARVSQEMERRWEELGRRLLASHPPKPVAPSAPPPNPGIVSSAAGSPASGPLAPVARDTVERSPAAEPARSPSITPAALAASARASSVSVAPRLREPMLHAAARAETARPTAAARSETQREEPASVVIQSLEVTVAAPPPAPAAAPSRARAETRSGAWSVTGRRYLTRI